MPFSDKSGQIFGFWKVLKFAGRDKNQKTVWHCQCICGKEKSIVISSLMQGKSQSCGCKRIELLCKSNTKHGMAGTPTYKSWHAMIQRCQGKGNHHSYLKRNITVCNEWLKFENFFIDMGIRPANKTLDRIDNKKGYFLENCRWATPRQQSNNTKSTIYVTVNEEKMPFKFACEKFSIGYSCARHRLEKGMTDQDIFTKPLRSWRKGTLMPNGVFVKD